MGVWHRVGRKHVTSKKLANAILILILAIFIVFAYIKRSYVFVNEQLECFQYSMKEENSSTVVVRIVGVYRKRLMRSGIFSGNVYIMDNDENAIGGKLDNVSFAIGVNDYVNGNLFAYNSNTLKYEFLGQMFLNIPQNEFVIQNSETYISYPNEDITGLNKQLDVLQIDHVQ